MDPLVDITPSPRILRTLGDIPFAPWQCLAELIDNSLDGFSHAEEQQVDLGERRIVISWSKDDVAAGNRSVEVSDTGPGMPLDVLQKCVRAGYSTNDPANYLGLFGMGFNIATARLGDKTTILSATPDGTEWHGIEIDFEELIKSGKFLAPTLRRPKSKPNEHGTRIQVSKLKPQMYSALRSSSGLGQLRKVLADTYSTILRGNKVEVRIQGLRLSPKNHCVWAANRYIQRFGDAVPARIPIERDLGVSLFDTTRRRFLTFDEEAVALEHQTTHNELPPDVIERQKRVTGWIGVQRYFDPDDYGLDFIRNGRKILRQNKALFFYRNPVVDRDELEYPLDLGTSVGGRIVGEIHVDHITPTYQKNDFLDRSDKAWMEIVEVLRGVGPILPRKRKALGFSGENQSAVARLVNAYRRPDVGSRNLAAPHDTARKLAENFHRGEADCESDERWWQAAVDHDRAEADQGAGTAAPVDQGPTSTDDPSLYDTVAETPNATSTPPPASAPPATKPPTEKEIVEQLKQRSRQLAHLSTEYAYEGCHAPIKVTVWELQSGALPAERNESRAVRFFSAANEAEFFFNPRHPFLVSYRTTFRELLLLCLAEKFRVRENRSDIDWIYSSLFKLYNDEARIDTNKIEENAIYFFERLREAAASLLAIREQEVLECIHESSGEVEEIAKNLMQFPELLEKFQKSEAGALQSIQYAPPQTLIRLVNAFPEEFFDKRFFRTAYAGVALSDPSSTDRLREEFRERINAYLKDALWATSAKWGQTDKEALSRCAYSITILMRDIVER